MPTNLVRISPKKWCLGETIHGRRRRQLLYGPGFPSIVGHIAKQATILTHKRTRIKKYSGYYRVDITLLLDAKTVDLFHNSSAGYRAQYYRSAMVGRLANDYALSKLVPRVVKLLGNVRKQNCPLWWVKKSLQHPEAKLWIHQGQWLRSPKKSDRNLMVKRWLEANSTKLERRLWATLTPATEVRIDLKGAPLTLQGKLLRDRLKGRRSLDIHKTGYT
ncbi:MAG: hypothetical protein HP497_06520 [Nitrospira sp.]|nr:hypothetical protein [Nitrospira sp.]